MAKTDHLSLFLYLCVSIVKTPNCFCLMGAAMLDAQTWTIVFTAQPRNHSPTQCHAIPRDGSSTLLADTESSINHPRLLLTRVLRQASRQK